MISKVFNLHANVTVANIFFNVLRYVDSKIIMSKNFVTFCNIRVIYKKRIMNEFNQA